MANAAPPAQSATAAIEKAKQPTSLDRLKAGFEKWRPTLAKILPKHIDPDRVIKIALNVYLQNPALQKCSWQSMLRATMQCAELGLDPSPLLGEAYFIPYENTIDVKVGNEWVKRKVLEVQLQTGYAGLIKLAKQTGLVADIYAVVVDKSEAEPKFDAKGRLVSGFYVEQGTTRKIHHIMNFAKERTGEVHAAYGVAKMADGSDPHFEVFTLKDIERIRGKSPSYRANPNKGPWIEDFEAMAKKTMIKQVLKYIPKSPEKPQLAQALAVESNGERDEGEQAFSTELTVDMMDDATEGDAADESREEKQPAQLAQPSQTQALLTRLDAVPHDADGVVLDGRRR